MYGYILSQYKVNVIRRKMCLCLATNEFKSLLYKHTVIFAGSAYMSTYLVQTPVLKHLS